MPMVKTTLVNGILDALATGSAAGSEMEVANKLADAIDAYIKSAAVSYTHLTLPTSDLV